MRLSQIRTEKYEKPGFEYLDIYSVNSKELAVRKDSIDETLLESILITECYQPDMWFNRNLREKFEFKNVKTVIDLGANIGLASCYFADLYKTAKIYSFEAEQENYSLLLRNTRSYSNISTYHKAIWKNKDGVYISNRRGVVGHSGKINPAKYMVNSEESLGEEIIDSISLSEFIKEEQIETIDILKIDIQGAEIELFQDSELWLPRVRLLFIELHDLFRKGCSRSIFEKMSKYGKFAFIGSPNGELLAFLQENEL